MSQSGAIAPYKGYRNQALYALHRILLSQSRGVGLKSSLMTNSPEYFVHKLSVCTRNIHSSAIQTVGKRGKIFPPVVLSVES
jgi:hypothetical protein